MSRDRGRRVRSGQPATCAERQTLRRLAHTPVSAGCCSRRCGDAGGRFRKLRSHRRAAIQKDKEIELAREKQRSELSIQYLDRAEDDKKRRRVLEYVKAVHDEDPKLHKWATTELLSVEKSIHELEERTLAQQVEIERQTKEAESARAELRDAQDTLRRQRASLRESEQSSQSTAAEAAHKVELAQNRLAEAEAAINAMPIFKRKCATNSALPCRDGVSLTTGSIKGCRRSVVEGRPPRHAQINEEDTEISWKLLGFGQGQYRCCCTPESHPLTETANADEPAVNGAP